MINEYIPKASWLCVSSWWLCVLKLKRMGKKVEEENRTLLINCIKNFCFSFSVFSKLWKNLRSRKKKCVCVNKSWNLPIFSKQFINKQSSPLSPPHTPPRALSKTVSWRERYLRKFIYFLLSCQLDILGVQHHTSSNSESGQRGSVGRLPHLT